MRTNPRDVEITQVCALKHEAVETITKREYDKRFGGRPQTVRCNECGEPCTAFLRRVG